MKRSAPEQFGGGKKTRCTPLPEDAIKMSIDLTKDDQVGDNKYEALSSGVYAFKPILLERFHKGAVRFYLSLHAKFSTFPTPIVLTTETVNVSERLTTYSITLTINWLTNFKNTKNGVGLLISSCTSTYISLLLLSLRDKH